jgi:hypothetical protein
VFISRINDPATIAAVTAAHERYEAALMANDIAALDGLFWQSPEAMRFGAGEASYGAEAIAEFRRARSPIGLARTVSNFKAVSFGDDAGVTTVEFERVVQGTLRHGRQTQVWHRFDDLGWKIVSAHVSLVDDSSGDLDRTARLIGLEIPASHRHGVQQQFARASGFAKLVIDFSLPDDIEAAAVFRP